MGEHLRSCNREKIVVAREVLNNVLSNMPTNDTSVGILTFNGWIYQVGPVDKDKMRAALDSSTTYPSGGTPLWEYIKHACDALLQTRQANGNVGFYKVLVVTDGKAGDMHLAEDHQNRLGYLSDILRRGITIDVIGLDMDRDNYLATKINGSYMLADSPDSLKQAVRKSVAEVGTTSPDVTQECFETVKGLPESFAKAVISGICTYENQPIGEKPQIKVYNQDGTTTVKAPKQQVCDNGGEWVIGGILGFLVLVIIIIAIAAHANSNRY
jgi:hypothetical protein